MEIVVTHLTRMRRGYICAAGICPADGRHVRPVLERGNLAVAMLERNGGVFALGRRLNLGNPQEVECQAPHLEDWTIQPYSVKALGEVEPSQFWALLASRCAGTLQEAFGPELLQIGARAWGTRPGQGQVSLAYLQTGLVPRLHIHERNDGSKQIRATLQSDVTADLAVTDKRLYVGHAHIPNEALAMRLQEALERSRETILAVGLGRAYPPGDLNAVNWLQINNFYPRECPLWQKVDDLVGSAK